MREKQTTVVLDSSSNVALLRGINVGGNNGLARTKLSNAYLDSTPGTTSTVRNRRTVSKLAQMCGHEQ